MVEMGGNQTSSGYNGQQSQCPSSPDTTLNLDPTLCLDNDQWLTVDISTLEQDVNSLYNSVFGSNVDETNISEENIYNVNVLASNEIMSQRCLAPISSKGKKQNNADVLQSMESDLWGLETDDPIVQSKCSDGNLDLYYETRSPLSLWGTSVDLNCMKMDDVFQVDKADLVQSPTLAELNANEESLFSPLDYYDVLLSDEKKPPEQVPVNSRSHPVVLSNTSVSVNNIKRSDITLPINPVVNPSVTSTSLPVPVTIQKNENANNITSNILSTSCSTYCASLLEKNLTSVPKTHTISSAKILDVKATTIQTISSNTNTLPEIPHNISQLSSSAPASSNFLQNWQEVSVIQKKQSMASASQRRRRDTDRSVCSFSSMSSLSNDDDFNSDADDDLDDDLPSSDNESLPDEECDQKSPTWSVSFGNRWTKSKKKKRFFWQYNIQSKGPKGPRISLTSEFTDPHILSDAMDPVFSSGCHLDGVKHAGKARKGDGNDLTPNPRKLYNIGAELKKLSKIINDLTPVSELPFNSRSKSRKEKNKLASRKLRMAFTKKAETCLCLLKNLEKKSVYMIKFCNVYRACRLKKKAQHEANKLKLYGLQQEHRHLLSLLDDLKEIIKEKIDPVSFPQTELSCQDTEKFYKEKIPENIAGNTSEFVNKVLDKVVFGDSTGGLSKL